jgi:hypothetical protein
MKKLIGLLLLVAACSPVKKENQEQVEDTVIAEVATIVLPSLTDAEKAEGWKLLFDGQTLNGWQDFKGRKNNTWEVLDGTLHCKALNEKAKGDGDERGDIMTAEEFADFELAFDWKISVEGNSGVIFRVTEEFEQPYYSGPEYQLIDDIGHPGKLTEMQKSGANYDMHLVEKKNLKPVGEWNSTKIVAKGNHVEHWLNGEKIVEYELGSADWKKRKEESKWKEWKGYGAAAKGHIDLQDHGSEVWFKNVRIKAIESTK